MTKSAFIRKVRQYASLARQRGHRYDVMIEQQLNSFLTSNAFPGTSMEDNQPLVQWATKFVQREYFDDASLRSLPKSKDELSELRRGG